MEVRIRAEIIDDNKTVAYVSGETIYEAMIGKNVHCNTSSLDCNSIFLVKYFLETVYRRLNLNRG